MKILSANEQPVDEFLSSPTEHQLSLEEGRMWLRHGAQALPFSWKYEKYDKCFPDTEE